MPVYFGQRPNDRAPFKQFVAQRMSIDESNAESFWRSRFNCVPAVYLKVDTDLLACASQKVTPEVMLKCVGHTVSAVQVPSFLEAALALTLGIYADSEAVAFVRHFSGRSSALDGIGTTLGPLFVEVPVQVNLQRNMTIERLIKERTTSMRQLKTHPALHYGKTKIDAVSEAARTASRF